MREISKACAEGRHAECTETMEACACTFRGGHATMHRYASSPDTSDIPEILDFSKGVRGKYFEKRCEIRQGVFDRWIIFQHGNPLKAWSGSRWVPATEDGVPTGGVQVCNFWTRDDAAHHAEHRGLVVDNA